ncbi:MAG: DUF262 domain-containing protein [Flavobacterium sp.]|nr:MAG: DUF262 domain-containing protein [Flavobacterium sp.]
MKAKKSVPIPTSKQIEAAESQIVEHSKKIEFYLTEYSVELLATKMKSGDFFVPGYQREFTWELGRKSKFIESLLMGLPIPFIFFWENAQTGKLEIVDGSQRLRTIEEFIYGNLRLENLEKLTESSGMKFSDFPESRQRKTKNRSIRGIVLNEHADSAARFDLFERINTGSKVANMAEVRRGALAGPFMDLVISLAEDGRFIKLTPMSDKLVAEREREELVMRFFAYSDGLDGYRDHVAPFLFEYAEKMNFKFSKDPKARAQFNKRFDSTMSFIETNFPLGFARTKGGKATPRSRYEAISIGSYLALKTRPGMSKGKQNVSKWLDSAKFRDKTGADGANAIKKLKDRIEFVRDSLLGK